MWLDGDYISLFIIKSYHYREFIFFNEKIQNLDFVFQKKNILIVFRYLNMFFMGQKPKYFGLYDIMFQKFNMDFGSVYINTII